MSDAAKPPPLDPIPTLGSIDLQLRAVLEQMAALRDDIRAARAEFDAVYRMLAKHSYLLERIATGE